MGVAAGSISDGVGRKQFRANLRGSRELWFSLRERTTVPSRVRAAASLGGWYQNSLPGDTA
jgi:hypothetical protein